MNALALIVGNSKYPNQELRNPENDATDFADILSRLGFKTNLKINIDQESLNKAIDSFGKQLDYYDIGLFYFAGHGIQIDGENFLTVINTNFESETTVQYSSITLNKILTYMERAQNKTNIIILDACRDNPFEKSWTRSIAQNGLAPMYAPKGSIIAYATSPGQKASDGSGRNGLYTSALLKHILDENITIEEFFKRVRNSVYAFSNGKQTSWEHTSLTGTFIFNSGQLIHSKDTPYASYAIIESDIELDSTVDIDKIIIALKSYNWYKQNPAINSIDNLKFNSIDKNKLFVLGRNILQAADGNSGSAVNFMENLDAKIRQFTSKTGDCSLLDGILFEMYFNSNGIFRPQIKGSDYLDKLASIAQAGTNQKSFDFIQHQLIKVGNPLFFILGKDTLSISFDIVLKKEDNDYILIDIKFEGEDVLVADNNNPYFSDTYTSYDYIYYENLKYKISEMSGVPLKYLSINTNYHLDNDDRVRLPIGFVIRKQIHF